MQKLSQTLISVMIAILLFSFFAPINAQDTTKPVIEWEKTFGAIRGREVLATDDGGFVIAGHTGNWDGADWVNESIVLFKIDTQGNVEWTDKYTSEDNIQALIATKDHGYAILLFSGLLKVDAQGRFQWQKTFDQITEYHTSFAITQTKDEGFAIVGSVEYNKFILIKTDLNGNLLMNKTYEPAPYRSFLSIAEGENGYLLAGSGGKTSMLLVKTNLTGDIQWEKQYSGYPECAYINKTSDGGCLLEGGGCIIKTDSDGNKQWNLTLTYNGTAMCFAQTNDGGYLLGGQRWFVVDTVGSIGKFSASGKCQWQQQFIATIKKYTEIRGLAAGSDGSSIFVGTKGERDKETIWAVKFAKDNLPSETFTPTQTVTPSSTLQAWAVPLTVLIVIVAFFVGLMVLFKRKKDHTKC